MKLRSGKIALKKNERITKELDAKLKKLDSETETAKIHIKINKEKNR